MMDNKKEFVVGRTVKAVVVAWECDDRPDTVELSEAAQDGLVYFYSPDDSDADSYVVICCNQPLTQEEVNQIYLADSD